MKKFIYSALILGSAVALASCSADEPGPAKNDGPVILTVQLPGEVATRFGEGSKVNQLYYSVFSTKAGNTGEALVTGTLEWQDPSTPLQVALDLVPSVDYNVVFFACNSGVTTTLTAEQPNIPEGGPAYGYNPTTADFKIDYMGNSLLNVNDEAYDAFYATKKLSTSTTETEISLTRPFAQINIGTDDLDKPAVKDLGYNNIRTNLIVKANHLATGMSLLNGTYTPAPDGISKYMGSISNAAGLKDEFPVSGYKYLNMMYLLVNPGTDPSGEALLDVEYQIMVLNGNVVGSTAQLAHTIKEPNLPARANYQTNIYGSLISQEKGFSVKIQPAYYSSEIEDDFTVPETQETLIALLNGDEDSKILIPEGTTFDLTTSSNTFIIKKGRTVTIKNNGTLKVEDETFLNQGDLTFEGSGTFNGTIYNLGGNLTINDGTFVSDETWGPIYAEGNVGVTTGGIPGAPGGTITIKGGTFSNVGSGTIYAYILDSLEIENATIIATGANPPSGGRSEAAVKTYDCNTVNISNSTIIGRFGGFDGYGWNSSPNITNCTIIVPGSGYCVSTQYNPSNINVLSGYYYSNGTACVSGNVTLMGGYFNKSVTAAEGFSLQTLTEPRTITWDNQTYSLGYQVVKN